MWGWIVTILFFLGGYEAIERGFKLYKEKLALRKKELEVKEKALEAERSMQVKVRTIQVQNQAEFESLMDSYWTGWAKRKGIVRAQ